MKKILLTGVSGQVGHALQGLLQGAEVVTVNSKQMNLADTDAIRRVVQLVKPDLIVNPAAYTAVDKAETEVALATAVNAVAPGVLAEEAAKLGAALVHFSTDYVYDGRKPVAYVETDQVNPVSVYGRSKLEGEEAIRRVGLPHLIFRTSWVYGSAGRNFLKTILRLASERTSLSIVADQLGAPTTDMCIAQAVCEVLQRWDCADEVQSGVYHLVNAGETSWHGFACAIVEAHRQRAERKGWSPLAVREILPIRSVDYPTPAQRPANSRLSTTKLQAQFGVSLPDWELALDAVMEGLSAPVVI